MSVHLDLTLRGFVYIESGRNSDWPVWHCWILKALDAAQFPPPCFWELLDFIWSLFSQRKHPRPRRLLRVPHAGQDGAVEHLLQVLLRQRGAFSKRDGADAPGAQASVVSAHQSLLAVRESDQHLDVLPQVALSAHEDDGNARTEAMNLGGPAGRHAPEGGRKNHAVAEQEDISFTVTERTEALKLILKTDQKWDSCHILLTNSNTVACISKYMHCKELLA